MPELTVQPAVGAMLAALDGRTAHLGTSYDYLTAYARQMRISVERAVFSLLGEESATQTGKNTRRESVRLILKKAGRSLG